jgi:hypothetical protein
VKFKVPYETYLLAGLLIFLSMGGIYGGLSLIIDSSGTQFDLNTANLKNYPYPDFQIPGLVLFILFGIIPLSLIIPLIKKPKLKMANFLNIYPRRYWAWTYSLYIGIVLIIWVDIQIWLIGYYSFFQIFWSFLGLTIIFVCLLPAQLRFFSIWKLNSQKTIKTENEILN